MKHWIVFPKKSENIIEQLLINRKIPKKDWNSFLNPKYENLHNPNNLNDVDTAVERIIKAIKNKETIGIFADYDADGIPGAAILANFFAYISTKTVIYIPTREEGYGLNEQGIKDLSNKGCRLIITVDLGITGKAQIKLAKKMGIDVIVTDHHLFKKSQLPQDAYALIHPKLSQKYSNKDLTGGAVAWKLICVLVKKLMAKSQKLANYPKWSLDLAAISTVCDIVPLVGENRIIAKYGMKVLSRTKNIGLEELMKIAKVDPGKISTYTLGFQIGPRINAPGRIDHAQISYYLLTTRNRREAKDIALKLDKINRQRQKELEKALDEALDKINEQKLTKNKIIILKDKKWSEGIIGLVAGKLTEKFCRPVVVFREGDKELKGSARSIPEFHILEALDKSKEFIIKYGGHAGAAGLQAAKKQYHKLQRKLIEIADIKLIDENLQPKIKIDAEVAPPRCDLRLFNEVKKLEPFGMGNSRPVFLTKRLTISDKRLVGREEKHLKLGLSCREVSCKVKNNNSNTLSSTSLHLYTSTPTLEAISFNCEECHKDLQIGAEVDIVYHIDENIWNGVRKTQLKIIDIKKFQKR